MNRKGEYRLIHERSGKNAELGVHESRMQTIPSMCDLAVLKEAQRELVENNEQHFLETIMCIFCTSLSCSFFGTLVFCMKTGALFL